MLVPTRKRPTCAVLVPDALPGVRSDVAAENQVVGDVVFVPVEEPGFSAP